jgi:predicted transcriptional regulator
MPKRKQKKERLSVSVTEDQKASLQQIADNSEVSLARVIQQAIKEFLVRHRNRRLSLFEKPPPKG